MALGRLNEEGTVVSIRSLQCKIIPCDNRLESSSYANRHQHSSHLWVILNTNK